MWMGKLWHGNHGKFSLASSEAWYVQRRPRFSSSTSLEVWCMSARWAIILVACFKRSWRRAYFKTFINTWRGSCYISLLLRSISRQSFQLSINFVSRLRYVANLLLACSLIIIVCNCYRASKHWHFVIIGRQKCFDMLLSGSAMYSSGLSHSTDLSTFYHSFWQYVFQCVRQRSMNESVALSRSTMSLSKSLPAVSTAPSCLQQHLV